MAEVERLSIVIDILDRYTDELVELMGTLEAVERTAERLDPIRIDVDVNDGELGALEARLAALEMADMAGFGDVSLGTRRPMGGGGGRSAPLMALGESFDDMKRSMRSMSRTLSNVDNSLSNVNRVASGAAHGLRGAEEAGGIFNLRMSTLHNILAKLIPMLLAFIGALPALIAALGALVVAALAAATALGGIGALGLLGASVVRGGGDIGSGFEDIVAEMKADFLDAFKEVSTIFAPLMEDAMDGFGRLMQDVANVVRSSFTQITDEARAFGAYIAGAIPGLVEDIAGLTEAFGPLFGMMGDAIGRWDIAARVAGFMADALPSLKAFWDVLADLVPLITRMSIGFLDVTAAVMKFINIMASVIGFLDVFNLISEEAMGAFIAATLVAITAVAILNSELFALVATTVGRVVGAVATFVAGMGSMSVSSLMAAAASKALAVAIYGVAGAIFTVLATTGIGLLLPLIGALGSMFLGTSDKIDTATDSLREFNDLARKTGRNPYGAPSTPDQVDAVRSGDFTGRGANVTINANGNEDVDKQAKNLNFRMSRTGGTL